MSDEYRTIITNPSSLTQSKRAQIKGLLDDFATFSWGKIDMFENFGAFILNDSKGSLKFYNGPSFTNEYATPQFQDGYTNLTGIKFSTQQISFTIGVYWISIEDYRQLMNFLHPYKVDYLSFSFEKEYGYYCKLSKIADSTRYIVGTETASSTNDNTDNKLRYSRLESSDQSGPRYYTELTLTFDVIGAQCAKGLSSYNDNFIQYDTTTYWVPEPLQSDLDMPLELRIDNINQDVTLTCTAEITYPRANDTDIVSTATLFKISLKNISENLPVSLRYDSEQGLLYWKTGDKEHILSLLSVSDSGLRIINSLDVRQFYWPGILNDADLGQLDWSNAQDTIGKWLFNTCPVKIILTSNKASLSITPVYSRRKRTNII